MSVLFVVHGFSDKMKTDLADFIPKHEFNAPGLVALTVPFWRTVEDHAKTLGIEPFQDGRYKVWIHPAAVYDLISDVSSVGTIDLIKTEADRVFMANSEFIQTTTLRAAYLFGSNSDLSQFKYFYQGSQ